MTEQPTQHIMGICPMWVSNFEVPSSKFGESYLVQFHNNYPASCSCKGYRFSGNYGEQHCKHIDAVIAYGCFYRPDIEYFRDVPLKRAIRYQALGDDITDAMAKIGIKWLNHDTNHMLAEECPGCGVQEIMVFRGQTAAK